MKTLEVFHVAFEEEPLLVATLILDGENVDCLDKAYRLSQNVDSSWVKSANHEGSPITPSPRVLAAAGCRSTSVGDYVRVDDGHSETFWRCAAVGWKQIHSEDERRLTRRAATIAAYRDE